MPPGHSCCLVGCTASSHNSAGEKRDDGLRFYRIPKVKMRQGKHVEEITARRRRAWIAAIRRPNITFEHSSEGMRVCSRHFHSGVPAYEMMESHPDWAPSLHLGHSDLKETDTSRHNRQKKRAQNTQKQQIPQSEDSETTMVCDSGDEMDCPVLAENENNFGFHPSQSVQCQTDLSGEDIDAMQNEINHLLDENRLLKEKLAKKEMLASAFEGDNEKVKYYTGLGSFATLTCLLTYLLPYLPQGNKWSLSPFQMVVVTFMRLRLNLPVQHIAYLFDLHRTTIANTFVETLNVMYARLSPLVYWPDRQSLRASMPHEFVEAFGNNVAVIIDCFEIFIERPSNLKARAQTFSHYKHTHTNKYLIGITPQGVISFISKGWGGRTSDKHVTENSGFLNNLLPQDIVLADRGFDIHGTESVGLMCAEVRIPAFTKGKCQMQCQMHAKDIEETRKLAHLRIHVERVIGNVVAKYTILADTIPLNLALPCEGEEVTFLDKIVTVCSALTNMCPSIVQ